MIKEKEEKYKVSLSLWGKIFTSEGKTLQEAIIKLKPDIFKGKSILTIQKGSVKKEKVLTNFMTARLFGSESKVIKEVTMKQITQMFNI